MSFSFALFAASLWTLSSEMVEDTFVDLVYGRLFGWRRLMGAMAVSGALLTLTSVTVAFYALTYLAGMLDVVRAGGGVILAIVGVFWLVSAVSGRVGWLDEAKGVESRAGRTSFLLVTQLVFVEELEVVLIVLPMFVSSHGLEAAVSALFGVSFSVTVAAFLKKEFERLVVNRVRYLKAASGIMLLVMGGLLVWG